MFFSKIYRRLKAQFYTHRVVSTLPNKPKGIKVASFCVFSPKGKVKVGSDFFAGELFYVSTNEHCDLVIGDSVMLGPSVYILGGNHNYKFTGNHLRYNQTNCENTKNIIIENGVWIGAKSTILSGAYISEGSVIGANSLVSHVIPPYVIALGSPAKKYIARFSEVQLKEILKNVGSTYSFNDIVRFYKKHNVCMMQD